MRYEQRMRKYWQKKLEDPLPKLPEDERIYLNVPYMARDFAKYSHCGFDPERKLWFTGSLNRNLYDLVELYGVNEATSEKAKALMKAKSVTALLSWLSLNNLPHICGHSKGD